MIWQSGKWVKQQKIKEGGDFVMNNIGRYEIKEISGRFNDESFSVQETCSDTSKTRIIYVGSLEGCAVLAVRLSSGEASTDDIVSVAAASVTPYYQRINECMIPLDVLYAIDGKVYLGARSRYDNHGHYNNSDSSLMFVSDNYDAFEILIGRDGGACSRKEIQESGCLTEDEFDQFITLNLYA